MPMLSAVCIMGKLEVEDQVKDHQWPHRKFNVLQKIFFKNFVRFDEHDPHRVGCIRVAPPCVVCWSVASPEQIPAKQTRIRNLADVASEKNQKYHSYEGDIIRSSKSGRSRWGHRDILLHFHGIFG